MRMPYPISPRMKESPIKLLRVALSITKMNDQSSGLKIEKEDTAWAGVVDNFLAIKCNSKIFTEQKNF